MSKEEKAKEKPIKTFSLCDICETPLDLLNYMSLRRVEKGVTSIFFYCDRCISKIYDGAVKEFSYDRSGAN